ncbi:MAG: hypothetical protein ABI895_18010 [Deltaproteobacteria bacterium]
MNKIRPEHCVASERFAHLVLAFLIAGCAADDSRSAGPEGASAGPFSVSGGQGANSDTGVAGTISSGGSSGSSSGTVSGAANPTPAGSDGTSVGTGGNGAANLNTGGTNAGISGSAGTAGSGAISPGAGGTSTGGVARTVELIGPGAARCGATNATHGDGFVCVLNYPSEGPNVVGYWFDYAFSAGTCNLGFTKPPGNDAANPQVCFSGSACPATSGGGLGVALCDVHGIDVSTWPQLASLEAASSLSSTVKSPLSGCNPGATITSIAWTLGSGSIPAGTSVLFDDAADANVARVDNLAPGATSVDLPANVDVSKVATIKFSVAGTSSTAWNFCLTGLTVSMR